MQNHKSSQSIYMYYWPIELQIKKKSTQKSESALHSWKSWMGAINAVVFKRRASSQLIRIKVFQTQQFPSVQIVSTLKVLIMVIWCGENNQQDVDESWKNNHRWQEVEMFRAACWGSLLPHVFLTEGLVLQMNIEQMKANKCYFLK